jgi:hypothetical protein
MGMSEESPSEGAVNNSIMDKLNADDDDEDWLFYIPFFIKYYVIYKKTN